MIAIDTFGPLPISPHGFKYVFAIVCCFTTFVELVPSFDNTAISAANALLTVFGRYGLPYYLRSDNAPNFTSNILAALRSLLDISADFTIPYRPQSNGIVERRIGTVLNHLRALIYVDVDVTSNWSFLLPIVQRICNATYVSSIGCSPSELIFGSGLHLNRGLTTNFTFSSSPPSPIPYINTLITSQTSLSVPPNFFLPNNATMSPPPNV
jgi:transposase InsO family protein